MPALKIVKVKKKQEDVPGGLPCVLGLNILNLLKAGYRKFELDDLGEVVEIKTWRIRRGRRNGG